MKETISRGAPLKRRGVKLAGGGMLALMLGSKSMALALFSKGIADLEKGWRADHPDVAPGWRVRWEHATRFYEKTHTNPVNRALHMAGIPLILSGAIGLVTMPRFSPPWAMSAGAFGIGWALNIVGHSVYEKNRPAFADDPLSFVAGPIWDLAQVRQALARAASSSST